MASTITLLDQSSFCSSIYRVTITPNEANMIVVVFAAGSSLSSQETVKGWQGGSTFNFVEAVSAHNWEQNGWVRASIYYTTELSSGESTVYVHFSTGNSNVVCGVFSIEGASTVRGSNTTVGVSSGDITAAIPDGYVDNAIISIMNNTKTAATTLAGSNETESFAGAVTNVGRPYTYGGCFTEIISSAGEQTQGANLSCACWFSYATVEFGSSTPPTPPADELGFLAILMG